MRASKNVALTVLVTSQFACGNDRGEKIGYFFNFNKPTVLKN